MTAPASEPPTGETLTVAASPADGGARLDRLLADKLDGLTRSRIQGLIRSGLVTGASGTISDPGQRVKPGETYRVVVPAPEPAAPAPEAIPLDVVHEDAHLLVIDKPAGLVVHPAAGHASGTLVNALIAHCGASLSGIGGVRRPGIVHRLDKETSGLLVVAKSDAAHAGLSEQFASHGRDGRLERAYLALVWGAPEPRRGTIEARIGRKPADRTRMSVARGAAGRHAVTHYEVIETFADDAGKPVASLVRVSLETGRTHQIRVHLAHVGHPVLGDPVYGAGFKASARRLNAEAQAALAALGRQALHAAVLGFTHPVTGRRLRFESPLPDDIAELARALAGKRTAAKKPAAAKRPARARIAKRS